jgi:hypothetical protein
MKEIIINEICYITAESIIKNAPIYCKGIRNGRELIKKKEIKGKYFIYARFKDGQWISSDGISVKFDKVLINKNYIRKIPELNEDYQSSVPSNNEVETIPDKIIEYTYGSFDIDVREDIKNEIFIKCDDIEKILGDKNINRTIVKRDEFIINEDYKYFKNGSKKELYMTYDGFIKFIFVCSDNKEIRNTATKTLFTVQMGTEIQKRELVSSVLGVTAKVVKEVFNADSKTLPCVYFFTLNTVKELRESMNIDSKYEDSSIVGKFGFTKDLSRRTGEHIKKYGEIKNCDLKLKHYSYIDPQYMSRAEKDIKDLMSAFQVKFEYKDEDELVIIPKKLMEIIESQYEMIGKKYIGHISELITKIKELENRYEIMEERHKNEILKKDVELLEMRLKLATISK